MGRSRLLIATALVALSLPTMARAAGWDDGASQAWKKTLEAARGEGNVVVLGRPDLGKPFADAFKRDTGLGLDFLGGLTTAVQARFRREVASGVVASDIILGGENNMDMIEPGYLMSLSERLMLPGVTDGANWTGGQVDWGDNAKSYLLIGGEYVHGWPLFNGNLIKPGEISSWQDILKPQYAGKIIAFDPREGAGGAAAAYIIEKFGIDFYRHLLVDQKMTLARDGRQVVEALARGTHSIALGAVPNDIEYFRSRGMKFLDVAELADGPGTLLGGSSVLSVAKKAPHPNAAIVFVNWYASRPGQEVFSGVWKTPSNRVDVSVPGIPDYTLPKPGRDYLRQYRQDWWAARRSVIESQLQELLGK